MAGSPLERNAASLGPYNPKPFDSLHVMSRDPARAPEHTPVVTSGLWPSSGKEETTRELPLWPPLWRPWLGKQAEPGTGRGLATSW